MSVTSNYTVDIKIYWYWHKNRQEFQLGKREAPRPKKKKLWPLNFDKKARSMFWEGTRAHLTNGPHKTGFLPGEE